MLFFIPHAYPRADSPDRPPTTGRNYLQPQQIISSQSRKLHADITELPQPLEVPAGPFPRFCYQLLSCSAKSLSSRIVSMRSSGALRTIGANAQICPATLPLYLRVISSTTRDYVARLQLVTVGLTKRWGKLAWGYACNRLQKLDLKNTLSALQLEVTPLR